MRKLTILLVLMLLGVSTSLAQSTRFKVTIENVGPELPVLKKGIFNTPVDAAEPGPIGPGGMYEFSFTAGPGNYLSFASMFIQSNDLFYTFEGSGLALFDELGMPVTGDVTSSVFLYDAGTEVNEEPGVGANQAPRQGDANTGDDESGTLSRITDGAMGAGGFSYPNVADVIQVSIAHDGGTEFTVTIANVSAENSLTTSTGAVTVPLSPGIWVVHSNAVSFFESGTTAPAGIEAIAEDGNPGVYDAALDAATGVQVPLAPGAWAVHAPTVNFFEAGAAASEGIEAIAEDGNPGIQAAALEGVDGVMGSGVFNTPVGADGPGPIGPGGSYSFYVDAAPGYGLSFATMFIQSNDLFYAPAGAGMPLFDGETPVEGDVTASVALWDAGTEVDEEPGVGPNQAPRQSGPDTGDDEAGVIVEVMGMNDGFTYPENSSIVRVTVTPIEPVTFYARIENIGPADAVASADGMGQGVPFAPGVWAVHNAADPLFTADAADRGEGLEGLAEDGDPSALATALESREGVLSSGAFNTPVGADAPGPLPPGYAYEFSFDALPGDYLSFATMFVQSNDLFYAPDGNGVALFDGEGAPRRANITHYVDLWDGGTEVNEEPGLGDNQAPRQTGPNTGDDEGGNVVLIADGEMGPGGFTYPTVASQIRVTISQTPVTSFRVLIENLSNATSVAGKSQAAVPLAPGVWAVHNAADPFFSVDQADRGEGLEALAEDGNPGPLAMSLTSLSGIVSSHYFNTPIGADAPAPIFPGEGYEFTVYAVPGDYLSLATMFVQSNDLFYAPDGTGIALFDGETAIDGDVTDQILLWDGGTEVNEEPGLGANQAPRQAAANTGDVEGGPVVLIADGAAGPGGFTYPNVADIIRVTVNGGTAVSTETTTEVPEGFVLHSNYPNPFNPTTTIRYEIQQGGDVSLAVFNVLGQKVAELITGSQNAGVYEVNWDGRDLSGQT
ncbi:MAG: spondin domain-containing protein, partial [Rhodothermales bacterium]